MRKSFNILSHIILLLSITLSLQLASQAQKQNNKKISKGESDSSRKKVQKKIPQLNQSQDEKYKRDKQVGKPVSIKIPVQFNPQTLKTISLHASVLYFQDLPTVYRGVDAIVVGRPTIPFTQRTAYATYVPTEPARGFTESILKSAWTIGPFQIDRVLYQNAQQGITGLAVGQTISLAEPVGIVPNSNGFSRFTIERLREIKHNSQYVLFLIKRDNGGWGTCNVELGRFNTDGTDYDDEVGGRQWKEGLRQELTAAYGVAFVVPSPVRSVYARINGGGAPRPPGLPPPPPPTGSITCTISAPQPTGMRLQIEQEASGGGSWSNIADIALTASAQTSSEPVSQTVDFPNGVLRGGARIRARLINGTQPSPWSIPTTVQLPI